MSNSPYCPKSVRRVSFSRLPNAIREAGISMIERKLASGTVTDLVTVSDTDWHVACRRFNFGCFQAREGQVLLHSPFDAHLDRFGRTGARILNLPLRSQPVYGLDRVANPDRIMHIASKDLIEATESLFEQLRPDTPNLRIGPICCV